MRHQFLLLPRLTALNANAQPAWWLVGPPALTAYAGFAQRIALAAGAGTHEGFAVIHHDIDFLGETMGRTLYPHQYRAASFVDKDDYSSRNPNVLSSQPTARCHLTASVVVRFADDVPVDVQRVARALRGARLAGGSIVEHGFSTRSDANGCLLEGADALDRLQRRLRRGFSVVDRSDLMQRADDDGDPLDTLLRVTRPGRERHEGEGWITPTALGFCEVTERRPRAGARGELPHAFGEALVGLVQFVPVRQAGLHFWKFNHPVPRVTVLAALN
jgi:CRISPR-associated protein Csy2